MVFPLVPKQGNDLKALKFCHCHLGNLLIRFFSPGKLGPACNRLKQFFAGRYRRRIIVIAILLCVMLISSLIINKNAAKVVLPIFAVFISGIIGYGALIDEKRFEKLYNSKLEVYRNVLSEIGNIQKIPVLFFSFDADKLPLEELRTEVKNANSNLNMFLVSNVGSYSALSALNRKVQEKLYLLILKFTEANKIGATNNRKMKDGDLYNSLDKSKLSLKSIRDIESFDSTISDVSSKLDMYVQVMLIMNEFNVLLIDLANEMRNDLEIGSFSDIDIDSIKKEFAFSINENFEFARKLINQRLKNAGKDFEIRQPDSCDQ